MDSSSIQRPLLAVSQNSGATWSFPESITAPFFIPNNTHTFQTDGIFSSASCNGNICFAAGHYTDSSSTQRPLLVISQDSGATWTYPESITEPLFTPNNTHPFSGSGNFFGASANTSLLGFVENSGLFTFSEQSRQF